MARSQPDIPDGYTIGYKSDAADLRFYVMAMVAVISLVVYVLYRHNAAIAAFALTASTAYYFYPLAEKGRARLGASEYGLFIDGFGIIDWRAVKEINLVESAMRTIIIRDLQIVLRTPVQQAMIADWRLASIPRMLMRLPWKLRDETTIVIAMEPFEAKAADVHDRLMKLWRFFGNRPRRVT